MLANREGRFKAVVLDCGVSIDGPNKLPCFSVQVQLTYELSGTEWVPLESSEEITGYFYLMKKDGSVNETAVEQLREALGWDGRDVMWLQDTDLAGREVQVVLQFEEWNGKIRLKMKWINPATATPMGSGVKKADDTQRRQLAAMVGAKLRAAAGGSPMVPTPAMPVKTPETALPSTQEEKPTDRTPPPPPKQQWSKNAAWEALWDHFGDHATEALCNKAWLELFDGSDPDALTAEEWRDVIENKIPQIPPF